MAWAKFFHILTVGAIGPKKLVNVVLPFFFALWTRRNTAHFNYVPSVLELELCMCWKCTWCLRLQWILDLHLHMRSLFKSMEAIKYVYSLSYLIYIVPLLSGQPLLSGHFSKSRGWPLNRGRTVIQLPLLYMSLTAYRVPRSQLLTQRPLLFTSHTA